MRATVELERSWGTADSGCPTGRTQSASNHRLLMTTPNPLSILLVDDDHRNVIALRAALSSFEGALVEAHSGMDALRCLLIQDFAVIVLDVHMPDMSGFETARLIRSRERSHSTPIIFLTADDSGGAQVREGYRVGAVDYMYKPFDPDILRAKVDVFVQLFRNAAKRDRETAELTLVTADLVQRERGERALNAALRGRTSELELASRNKSDFLSNISHELRTPLNAIIGFSEVMLDHDDAQIPVAQRRTFLEHIQTSGHHLLGLVNDILDLAKVEAGRIELSLEPVLLEAVLIGCADVIRAVADPKLLTLVVKCEPAGAVVVADPARLKQILYNLLSNAVKFTPTGGRISLMAQVDASEAVISVRDNGVGISPEDQDLIFEPFHQAKVAGQSHQEGTGLGLPLARLLVELHKGRIWFGSTPGVGSCVSFTLPQGLNLAEAAGDASQS
ncbi:MAG: response regulator [Chloroflexi bacterium]|nr:response regulator [Chloroflexota bacterium]